MSSRTILVVEDNEDSQALFRMALEHENYNVAVASTGAEALGWLANHPAPSLMLMDLMMPDMGGGELLAALKNHPDWRDIKVVIVSGRDHLQNRAKELGADGSLAKPVELNQLYSEVTRHLH